MFFGVVKQALNGRKAMLSILLAESSRQTRQDWAQALEDKDFKVFTAADRSGLEIYLSQNPSVIVVDFEILQEPIHLFAEKVRLQVPEASIIVVVSPEDTKEIGEAAKLGIQHILTRPVDGETLLKAIGEPTQTSFTDTAESVALGLQGLNLEKLPSVHKHPLMKKALALIKNVAPSDITVLISGESGVGKEVFAKTLYEQSLRRSGHFVGLNCASVPANLLEAELFGSEKGAYTGANARRIGKFEMAQNGTILLDEISEIDLNLQSKLLRVIQEKEMYRVGGTEKISLNFRLVATTNRDLQDWVKQGRFREDLFYRLNVISVVIPPLRERMEDIPVLAKYFIANFNMQNPGRSLSLSDEAASQLMQYNWPGNVRELENILLRTAFLTKGKQIMHIHFDESGDKVSSSIVQMALTGTIDQMERKMIRYALEMHDGNRIKAAESLGISVRTLRNKLRLYREEAIKTGESFPFLDMRPGSQGADEADEMQEAG